MSGAALHLFLVAGEESGDRLGADLMRAIKAEAGQAVRFSGVGGALMREEGLSSLLPLHSTAVMGFSQLPFRICNYLRDIKAAATAVLSAKPDALVIIDSPEFSHRIAKRVRRADPGIPIVDYVCPSVWAWRPGRARAMRRYIDHVLALLPFEPAVLAKLNGPDCTFAGHPVGERAGALRPDPKDARRRDAHPPVMLLMPGSRHGEISRMLSLFQDVAEQIAERRGEIEFILPSVPALAPRITQAVSNWRVPVRIVTEPNEKDAAFRIARAAIVKSGTSTLELAVAGIPMVATYRVSPLEAFVVRRMLRVDTVILANLVLGEKAVPEFLQENATARQIVDAALPLLDDSPKRRRQLEAFNKLDGIMEIGRAVPSKRAADVVLRFARV